MELFVGLSPTDTSPQMCRHNDEALAPTLTRNTLPLPTKRLTSFQCCAKLLACSVYRRTVKVTVKSLLS